ncbi:calcium binding protein, putative [Perkinsus marinus ATCC 50983]|uniref:Calcium binding protein, putative n=1 Tax=Perkinsus marinus (strain ATCC 50983 / TXsc) TaxID=423536 RepID=C5KIR4_PERM5|nr:calcium binding protein, putative [Perkinsus marinus ATCC 50983]EER15629.1 calcium binding protein, putative [Perkinsus marinus ATCC 50983]|eukprot:XP_002783833.1 calcium binding protein, putative [Perkinsus marinus ATCC 50983]
MANAFEGPGGRRSSASKLFPPKFGTPTGQEVDEEKLLHIFKEIDTDHSGSIDLDELGEAMRMLGIKCTYAFVRKALRSIDTDRNGTIEPHEFVKFFSTVTNPDEFRNYYGDLLGKQNQKYYDYKTMASEDPTFGRRFRIPQTISREHKISKHQESVESVKWLDRNRFISASLDRTVKIWDVSAPLEPLASFDYPSPIYSMTASPKGTWAVMGFGKAIDKEEQMYLHRANLIISPFIRYLSVLDIDNKNTEKAQMKGQDSPVFATAISPGEMYIASGSKSGRVLLHDVRTCKLLSELRRSPRIIQAIDFSEDARRVVSCGNDGDVALTDISLILTGCTNDQTSFYYRRGRSH